MVMDMSCMFGAIPASLTPEEGSLMERIHGDSVRYAWQILRGLRKTPRAGTLWPHWLSFHPIAKRLITVASLMVIAIQPFSSLYGQCFAGSISSLGELYESTGREKIDRFLEYYKRDMEKLFGVTAPLYFYRDGASPNAWALPCESNSYCDGIVVFGYELLFSTLLDSEQREYAVIGVLAHEFAHVVQFVEELDLPTMLKELHADFLAGYYIGRRKVLSEGVENFANTLFKMGDFSFWNPNHHGTPQERVSAMMAGFLAGQGGMSIDDAYAHGVRYVRTVAEHSDYEICDRCGGTGKLRYRNECSLCKGYGVITCSRCRGQGRYYTYGSYGYGWYRCGVCKGRGRLLCRQCEGMGVTEHIGRCYLCNGEGRVRRK